MRFTFVFILIGIVYGAYFGYAEQLKPMQKQISLPPPQLRGEMSLEQAIAERRSRRSFSSQELTLAQIGQLLWSGQGITEARWGFRAAPSAGALYPTELYLLSNEGLFHYSPRGHKLDRLLKNDLRRKLAEACLGQSFIAQAPISIVISVSYGKVASRYGLRATRYTDIEVGHIAQNIHLQAQALGLGSVPIGAFDDREVKKLLQLKNEEQPLYVIPVGYPK